MMTVITRISLKEGSEPEWDTTMRERMASAERAPGWISGQLLMPLDSLNARMIVGVWETRADWEAWHEDEAFRATAERLADLEQAAAETSWHEVIYDAPAGEA